MASADTSDELLADEPMPQVHSIDIAMSAPSITIANDLKNEVTGSGLALADVAVEQDRAYWEWRVKIGNPSDDSTTLMFGVSNKRNAKFYEVLAESTVPPEKMGTKFMGSVSLNDGDVVGVVVQQSELPMIQFYVNGEIMDQDDGGQVARFRGTVFPSVYLPPGSASATFLYSEDQFIHGPPSPDIDPLIAERSLM
eukprot:CAMPEP_0201888534 /NCGR_PEP_ID=MMETSP0902-20130614/27864_1 /ASSEMBLY_ACC=CAM_ASM_000551 /TAXON_ID=420261 /ORGANISM="Thalassiosira antarctica, Strain CCMP982" /LENGTH=195 /DNA_ID=CAMNT_0048418815 /DNA_START=78 /DNA_END=665 /DNA_ORIENTATION=+